MKPLTTDRLRLIPATAELIRLEMEDLPEFFNRLDVQPIVDWPSTNLVEVLPFFRDQLEGNCRLVGWLAWYWLFDSTKGTQLVGGGGFKGAAIDGIVEIGYETRNAFQCRGLATEAVRAQVQWALGHSHVEQVIAETHVKNVASIRVLEKVGFVRAGLGSEEGLIRHVVSRDSLKC